MTELIMPGAASGEVARGREDGHRHRCMNDWLLSQLSRHTRTAYRNDVLEFFRWADEWRDSDLGGLSVFEFQRAQLDAYRTFLESGEHDMRYRGKRKYQPSTIARKLTAVSSFYNYLVQEKGHPANPTATMKRPKVGDESTTPGLVREEVDRLLAVADRTPRDAALVRLLLGAGLRIAEVVGADTGDIATDRGKTVLNVLRKGGKREKVAMPDSAARALREYVRHRKGPLFVDQHGAPLNRNQVTYRLKRLAREAGIDVKLTPHCLRHTMATLALDRGAALRDVQQQLGHADPKTTIRYDRARTRLDNSALRAMSAILDGEQ